MAKTLTLANRQYRVVGFEGVNFFDTIVELEDIILNDSQSNEYEFIYSLQEQSDLILNLKNGESTHFFLNRDNNKDKGVIIRIE